MDGKLPFNLEPNGYSPDQVDRYIKKLSDEYTVLHSEYMRSMWEYGQIEEENQDLRAENRRLSVELPLLRESSAKLNKEVSKRPDDVSKPKGSFHLLPRRNANP